jgi:flap endonuclease-1
MGLSQFFQLYEEEGKEVKLEQLQGKKIAVDAYNMIYRAMLAPKTNSMTTKNGKITAHIRIIFTQLLKFMRMGIKQIWIFDGKPPEIKNPELERRTELKEKAKKDMENADEIKKETYVKRTFQIIPEYVNDIKELLTIMQIPWIQAEGEADPECANLVNDGMVDAVLSSDPDVFLYGCSTLIKPTKHISSTGKSSKSIYKIFNLYQILTKFDLSFTQFIDIALHLGTDYASKTKGVGLATVMSKVKEKKIELDENQFKAKKFISTTAENLRQTKRDININEFSQTLTEDIKKKLIEHLVKLDFDEEKIKKLFEKTK